MSANDHGASKVSGNGGRRQGDLRDGGAVPVGLRTARYGAATGLWQALIALIWGADSNMRDSSMVGKSEMDRQSRRRVARICGGAIAVLVLLGTLGGLWWFLP